MKRVVRERKKKKKINICKKQYKKKKQIGVKWNKEEEKEYHKYLWKVMQGKKK